MILVKSAQFFNLTNKFSLKIVSIFFLLRFTLSESSDITFLFTYLIRFCLLGKWQKIQNFEIWIEFRFEVEFEFNLEGF